MGDACFETQDDPGRGGLGKELRVEAGGVLGGRRRGGGGVGNGGGRRGGGLVAKVQRQFACGVVGIAGHGHGDAEGPGFLGEGPAIGGRGGQNAVAGELVDPEWCRGGGGGGLGLGEFGEGEGVAGVGAGVESEAVGLHGGETGGEDLGPVERDADGLGGDEGVGGVFGGIMEGQSGDGERAERGEGGGVDGGVEAGVGGMGEGEAGEGGGEDEWCDQRDGGRDGSGEDDAPSPASPAGWWFGTHEGAF